MGKDNSIHTIDAVSHKLEFSEDQIALMNQQFKKRSQLSSIWFRFRRNKLALVGLVIFILLILISVSAPLWIDYETDCVRQHIADKFHHPDASHLFGTDQYGRDIFARIIWGSRVSLYVGLFVVLISLILGLFIGGISGFYGGKIDNFLMRLMDVVLAIPGTLLNISIVSALGNSIPNLLIALSVTQVPRLARIVRASILQLKGQEFIEACYACGTPDARIIMRHIMPNALGPIIVQCALTTASIIKQIAGLSFIGLGIQPPSPEWGAMLSDGKLVMLSQPWIVLPPGIAICITVASLTLIGDGLRDALDPKMKK